MFLAIAVDNLANAQILTEDEENEKRERELNRALNKQRYTHKSKGWGKAGAKLPVVMAINHFVRKRNGHASPTAGDPATTTWLVNCYCAYCISRYFTLHKSTRQATFDLLHNLVPPQTLVILVSGLFYCVPETVV